MPVLCSMPRGASTSLPTCETHPPRQPCPCWEVLALVPGSRQGRGASAVLRGHPSTQLSTGGPGGPRAFLGYVRRCSGSAATL